MKKNFNQYLRRVGALLLVAIMLMGTVACSKNEGESTDTAGVTVSTDTDELKPVFSGKTYNGEEFTVLSRQDSDDAKYLSELGIETLTADSSAVDKAVYDRNKLIEEQFDISFVFLTEARPLNVDRKVSAAVLSEPDEYDLIVNHGINIFGGVLQGYYADWNNLEYVNLDAPWWSQDARAEFSTPGGRVFCMNGDLSYLSVGTSSCMFFNKAIINNANIKSPYDYVKEDNWTLESFKISVRQSDAAIGGDGMGDLSTDGFGYATEKYRGPGYVTFCTGASSLVLGNNGKYTIGFDNERVVNAVGDYVSFITTDGACYFNIDTTVDAVQDAFINGNAAFIDDNVRTVVEFKGKGVDFGIVPWPKYDNEVENYTACVGSGTNIFAVLKNSSASNLERISDILEAMSYYGSKNVVSYYFDTVVSAQAARDEDSYDNLQIIHECLDYDLGGYAAFGDLYNITRLMMSDPSTYGTSVSTALEVLRGPAMLELEIWYSLDTAE